MHKLLASYHCAIQFLFTPLKSWGPLSYIMVTADDSLPSLPPEGRGSNWGTSSKIVAFSVQAVIDESSVLGQNAREGLFLVALSWDCLFDQHYSTGGKYGCGTTGHVQGLPTCCEPVADVRLPTDVLQSGFGSFLKVTNGAEAEEVFWDSFPRTQKACWCLCYSLYAGLIVMKHVLYFQDMIQAAWYFWNSALLERLDDLGVLNQVVTQPFGNNADKDFYLNW